jgi:hypothetical protein
VFGGFCLLLFFCRASFSRLGVWLFFDASFGWLLGRISLIGLFGFCLESLILAQDERWRRA